MLETFKPNIDNFGIILKGKSIEQLAKVYKEYDDCFLVNNVDKEIEQVGEYLIKKRTVHFVNRLMTAPITSENYRKLDINEVQLCKTSSFRDKPLKKAIAHYRSMGLRAVFLPKKLLKSSKDLFGPEYSKKFPNTGLMAILYALEIIKPRNIWIIGLDFYQSDYLVRRPHQAPIEQQRKKMKHIKAVDVFQNWIDDHPSTNVYLVSYYDGLKPQQNLEII